VEDLLVVFLHHQKQEGHGGDGDGRAVSLSLRPPSPFCSCRNGLESLKALRRLGERILVMILATCGARFVCLDGKADGSMGKPLPST